MTDPFGELHLFTEILDIYSKIVCLKSEAPGADQAGMEAFEERKYSI